MECELALQAEAADVGAGPGAVDVDLPVERRERGEVVWSRALGIVRELDPGETVAGVELAGAAFAEIARAVVDVDLRDGAEEKRAGSLRTEQCGQDARNDLQADEEGEVAVGGDGGEGLVGGGDKAARKGDAFRLVGVEDRSGCAVAEHGGELPGEIDGVADAGVHALAADRRVNVRGVAEQENAAVAEVLSNAVVDAVRGEPVHALDVDLNPVEDALGDVVPGKIVIGLFGLFVANGADKTDAAVVVQREDGEEVGVVESDVEFAIGDAAGRSDVCDVEEVAVLAAGEADVEPLPHDGAGAVAAGEEAAAANLPGAVGQAQAGGDGFVGCVGGLGEGEKFGRAFDRNSKLGEVADEQRLVLVLRVDEGEGKGAEAAAEAAEGGARDLAAGDPEVDGSDAVAVFDELVREAELRIELERAGLHGERTRVCGRVRVLVDDADADAEACEPQRKHQARRTGAGDEDLRIGGWRHRAPQSGDRFAKSGPVVSAMNRVSC